MKNTKKLMMLVLVICLAITGCSKKTEEESTAATISKAPPVSSEKATESATEAAGSEPEVWNPAVVHRQVLFDEECMAGVLFLGYVDGSAGNLENDRDYYQSVFEDQGYLEDFPFLAEIPNSNFVQTEYGQELYCIIPQDDMATVSVNQWIVNEENDFKGEAGEVLYRSETGSPILLKCNVSEIVPDVEVVIVDNKGNQLQWCPSLSGMDGSVAVDSSEGKLYDFTIYPNDESVEILDVLVGKVYDYYWSDEFEVTLASMTAPIVELGKESAAAYPELSTALTNNINDRRMKLFEAYENLIPMAEEFYPEFAEYFSEFEAKEEAMIRRADSNVLSVLYHGTAYEGGAHGYYYYFGENYNSKTGELLKLEDVVTDLDAIPALVQEQLDLFWEPAYFYEDLDLNQYFKENQDNIAWTLDYHGITFFFNPYEIAPYASGVQVVTVSFADHPELFAEEYTRVPESYGIQIGMENTFYYDFDSDGNLDELIVLGEISDDLIHVKHNIYLDGEWYDQSAYGNDDIMPDDANVISAYEIFNPHLIHLADGRNYLFIENLEDSDFRTNTVYELTDGTVKMVETLYSSLHTEWSDSEEYWLTHALTNPYHFEMETRTWVVGTGNGYMTNYIGDDGHSYSYENYYTFDPAYHYTALRDVELKLVDEYGVVGDVIVVKAGDELTYYRTDASLFADFILSDGRIVRAELEWDEGTCSIDGTSVDELFDGVVFAG